MGSTGKGEFGNYPHLTDNQKQEGSGGGFIFGGLSESCPESINLCMVEYIFKCDYYVTYKSVPSKGELVYIDKTIHSGRIVVCLKSSNMIIGNLPSVYNKDILCFQQNDYEGEIDGSGLFPVPNIVISVCKK